VRLMLLIALLAGLATPAIAAAPDRDLLRRAFLFGFPVYEVARTRWEHVGAGNEAGRPAVNTLIPKRDLADDTTRYVTTPNNDTLYTFFFLDLSAGPAVLTVPPSGERYLGIGLMDIFTDNFAVLGTRVSGAQGKRYWVVGPRWRGTAPADVAVIRATSNDVWGVARVLVDGPDDLPAAHAAQDRIALNLAPGAGPVAPTHVATPLDPDAKTFLTAVNEMLGRSPLPPEVAARIAPLAPVGIRPGAVDVWEHLSAAVRQAWNENLPQFRAEIQAALRSTRGIRGGWVYPRPALGNFGAVDRYRAVVALGGLGALPVDEAIYASALADSEGRALDGAHRYRLRLPAGAVPVEAFWSLSMYRVAPSGALYFAPNPIRRYALGDRTAGLKRNADGSIDILIQHDRPADGANWLPAPPGAFRPIMRAYLPRTQRLDLPALTRVD